MAFAKHAHEVGFGLTHFDRQQMITLAAPLKPVTDEVVILDIATKNKKPWIVWWHSGIYKNQREHSEPKVLVAFRELDGTSMSKKLLLHTVPLTQLGKMRIGTVWLNGKITHAALFQEHTCVVNFDEAHWNFTSCSEPHAGRAPYPDELHPFWGGRSGSWLVEFRLPQGGYLVIPCLEIFTRLYGRSQEIKRVLATYSWQGMSQGAEARLTPPTGEPEKAGYWKIKQPSRLGNGDSVFLAHVKYDEYARRAAQRIYAQLQANYSEKSNQPIFIKVRPWFCGPAKVRVRGYWFGKSFLGIQIMGCSEPDGPPIICIKEENELVDDTDERNYDNQNIQTRPLKRLLNVSEINIAGDTAPDRDAVNQPLTEDTYEVLGKPRKITNVRVTTQRIRTLTTSTEHAAQKSTITASGAEPSGSGKSIRHGLVYASQAMESKGALLDIWNALHERQKRMPDRVSQLAWCTFEDGFQDNKEPKLIRLLPIYDKKIETSVRHWVYADLRTKALRGILVMRACIDGKDTFFVEIQRRTRVLDNDLVESAAKEENLKGLIFQLTNLKDLHHWLIHLRSEISYKKGIVSRLTQDCPGTAAAYSHTTNSVKDAYLYESALENALSKLHRLSGPTTRF